MSEAEARHRGRTPKARRLLKRIAIGFGVFLMVISLVLFGAYRYLQGNITSIDMTHLGKRPAPVIVAGPTQPINILVMGSDTRAGANGKGIGGSTPGLSDTTIILHLSANRKFAYGISLPRDAMVERPSCEYKNGSGVDPGGLTQFNAAYAIGGPLCTVKTVEHLTGIRINHFVVVDFVGFRSMVDAIGGVTICVPSKVNDDVGHITLPAGTYNVTGQQALDYVRVRHDIGAPTGDIGRMKRQQAFISAMIKKVVSAGTLANPLHLFNFLNAATKSLTTDSQFASLRELADLGASLKNIGLDNVQFITVPWQPYAPDPNRVEWAPNATRLWYLVKHDRELGSQFNGDAVSPGSGTSPTSTPTGTPTATPTGTATSGSPSTPSTPTGTSTASAAQKKADAQAAGLCT
ncbi:MAG: LytR family transcriptional regulator [Marmoricola sp.]|nr:LytR family transcriptional regulator [Marmoricola sp.]